MILTARQLEDLHKSTGGNGHLTLPYRARLTPLACDWVKARKIVLGYSDVPAPGAANTIAAPPVEPLAASHSPDQQRKYEPASGPSGAAPYLWRCDGPCGPAKAALTAHEKELRLR